MPWPNDVLTREVTGTYLNASGVAAKGRVTFTPTSVVVDKDDAVVIDDTQTAVLGTDGSFSIELPTTDNKLLSPEGWAYEVSVRLYGVKPVKFFAYLPYGDGLPIDISSTSAFTDVTISAPSTGGGLRGPVGPRGPGVLVGSGPPSNLVGFDGDTYIDVDTGSYYGPKTSGAWPASPFYQQPSVETPRHVHVQPAVSATWTITHSLGGRPSVTVVDTAQTVVIGEITYNSDTEVTISFTSPFSGFAYLT